MGRRSFNTLLVISLLLFAAGGAGWIVGCFGWQYESSDIPHSLEIRASDGVLTMQALHLDAPLLGPGEKPGYCVGYGTDPSLSLALGFIEYRKECVVGAHVADMLNGQLIDRTTKREGSRHRLLLRFPWLMLVATALPLGWLVVQHGKRKGMYRRAKGLCVGCGYDLRASKDRCPECGTPIADRRASTSSSL